MYCATDRLKVTNDDKKTNRAGQVVSNVSDSIKSASDCLIFLLGLRSVGGVSQIDLYQEPENLQGPCVTLTDIVIVADENFPFLSSFIQGVSPGVSRVVNMACLISDLFIVDQASLLFV